MAKVTLTGKAVVITSSLKLDDIKTVEKYRPDALTLKGGDDGKEVLYRVATGNDGNLGKYGATFDSAARDGGYAQMTMLYENDCANEDAVKADLADRLGAGLAKLSKLEAILPEVVASINAERADIMSQIELN